MKRVFIFTAGAAIGSAVTWKLVKTKYEQIANEEIASVKEAFSNSFFKPELFKPRRFLPTSINLKKEDNYEEHDN